MKKTAWVAALVAGMVGVASAEVIYVDFYDDGTVNSSPETYNVLHSDASGPGHPAATAGGGLSMTGLVDTNNAATGADVTLYSYNDAADKGTAAGSAENDHASEAHNPVAGIATNALSSFWLNDQGRDTDFGYILTFSNLTAEAYNISMLAGSGNSEGTWFVTKGAGDISAKAYTSSQSDVLDWTSVVPSDGTIELTSVRTGGGTWRNVTLSFVSLEAVALVQEPPTAVSIETNVLEGASVNITLSGSDPEGNPVTYSISQPANGTVTPNGALPNVTYTPDVGYAGNDSFTYTVNDGDLESALATVSITVDLINDFPPVADDLSVITFENRSTEVVLRGSDPDGTTATDFTYSYSQPTHGTLSGTAPNLTYTPDTDYYGSDIFTYTVNDGDFDSAVATVTIMVNEVADGELILNGDFEMDDITGNNVAGPVTAWNNGVNMRTDASDTSVPGAPNQVIRLKGGTSAYQNFSTSWSSNDTFTVEFNACNVYWKTGTEPILTMSLQNATGMVYVAETATTAQTHDGSSTYADWTTNMTWSFTYSGQDLIDAGASANEELRINFLSDSNKNSINFLDNVSVMFEAARPAKVGDISVAIVSGGTGLAFTWPTEAGWKYGVEMKEDLILGSWSNIMTDVEGTGDAVSITNLVLPDADAAFFRAYLQD